MITFKIISFKSPEHEKAVSLREEILRKPLGLAFSTEELECEKDHIHIAGFQDEEIIATAVLVIEGKKAKMQRVAVKMAMQGQGIGSKMIVFCEEYGKKYGITSLYCYARESTVNFYLKNNYIPEGTYFNEDTIPHIKMSKIITFDLFKSTQEEQEALDYKLGDFNTAQVPQTQEHHTIPFSYCFKNDDGKVIAGINAELYLWHVLYIAILFIGKDHRHQNLGSFLLRKVEEEAKAMGSKLVHTDTYDFQAKDFYLKHGYDIFGVLDDCPEGHKRYYLKKKL